MKVNRFTRFLGKRKRRTFKNIFPWCMVLSLILSAVLANYSVKEDTYFKEEWLVDYIKDERSRWTELLNHDDYDLYNMYTENVCDYEDHYVIYANSANQAIKIAQDMEAQIRAEKEGIS